MGDSITLTIPREEGFFPIARLVLGGVASRHNLTYENLEDLELALDELLEDSDEGELTVELCLRSDGSFETSIGPFDREALRAQFEREGELSLRRILETVADRVEIDERDGNAWVELAKRIDRLEEAR